MDVQMHVRALVALGHHSASGSRTWPLLLTWLQSPSVQLGPGDAESERVSLAPGADHAMHAQNPRRPSRTNGAYLRQTQFFWQSEDDTNRVCRRTYLSIAFRARAFQDLVSWLQHAQDPLPQSFRSRSHVRCTQKPRGCMFVPAGSSLVQCESLKCSSGSLSASVPLHPRAERQGWNSVSICANTAT
jgi:hypothetical protein